MRKLDPKSFAELMAGARQNGGLPRMCALMAQVLTENGYARGVEIFRDYVFFERPFDSRPDVYLTEVLASAERANLETGGAIPNDEPDYDAPYYDSPH